LLIETGYRCAIPHCRETDIQIHHIEGYAVEPKHTFNDLVALCANCHQRVTSGKIDKRAIRQIKANLSVFTYRYGELERRYLEAVASAGGRAGSRIELPLGFELLMANLVQDEIVTGEEYVTSNISGVRGGVVIYQLTEKGQDFLDHWLAADPLD
jgi:hypothetical protein